MSIKVWSENLKKWIKNLNKNLGPFQPTPITKKNTMKKLTTISMMSQATFMTSRLSSEISSLTRG